MRADTRFAAFAAAVLVCASCGADDGSAPSDDDTAAMGSGGTPGNTGFTASASGGVGGASTGGMSGGASGGTGGATTSGTNTISTGGAKSVEPDAGRAIDRDAGMLPGDGPAFGTVENSGAGCPMPALPDANQLTAFEKHHDPFLMLDGTRIAKKDEWRCRRAEILAQLEQYESGPKPTVAPEDVSAELSGDTLSITVRDGADSVDFAVKIERPASATGDAVPLVIEYNVETLDTSVFAQNGVATLVYDNDAMGAESGAGSRGTGTFYDLYGRDHAASSMVAWAWGVSRIIDALERTPEAKIDPSRIAVTGCSRYGKGALLAGALDERIALTIPQESGAGGSSSWRVAQAQSAMGENVQTLSNAAGEQPWFRADFAQNFGGANVTKLPFDHHMVLGLVAPRALLVIDNQVDWLGIDSSYTAGSIAHAIWDAFDLPDHMGYWQTGGHTHCQFPAEQRDMLEAYVKKFLIGSGTGDTAVLLAQNANADLDYWMEWTPPVLQ
jgi:hypothetical protein